MLLLEAVQRAPLPQYESPSLKQFGRIKRDLITPLDPRNFEEKLTELCKRGLRENARSVQLTAPWPSAAMRRALYYSTSGQSSRDRPQTAADAHSFQRPVRHQTNNSPVSIEEKVNQEEPMVRRRQCNKLTCFERLRESYASSIWPEIFAEPLQPAANASQRGPHHPESPGRTRTCRWFLDPLPTASRLEDVRKILGAAIERTPQSAAQLDRLFPRQLPFGPQCAQQPQVEGRASEVVTRGPDGALARYRADEIVSFDQVGIMTVH